MKDISSCRESVSEEQIDCMQQVHAEGRADCNERERKGTDAHGTNHEK